MAQESVLRVSPNGVDIATLDPHRAVSTTDKAPVAWMFNGLVRFLPGSADPTTIEPDLAESWDVSEDGLVWTFKLRQGVLFHGEWGELTADDVVYSIQRASNPDTSSFSAAFANIEEVAKVDDYTVTFRLVHPDAAFINVLANFHGGNIVSKRAAEELGADFANNPVGTGPFMFQSHVTQQKVTLVANEAYFRGAPQIERIEYLFIPSDSSRELAYNSGELDIFYARRDQLWIDMARDSGIVTIDVFSPGEYRLLHVNRTIAPLDDVLVRRAVAHAINTKDIEMFVGPDIGPAGCSVIPSGYLGEDCSYGAYEYDVELAKSLLAEAGHPDGITISMISSNISAHLPVVEILQAQLAQAGITLDINVVDHPTYHEQIRRNLSGMVFYGAARFPVADTYLSEFFDSAASVGQPTAIANFSHCDIADEQIAAAKHEADADRQLALWAEAQRLIHEDVCAIPINDMLQVWGRNAAVDYGYELTGALNLAPPVTERTVLNR